MTDAPAAPITTSAPRRSYFRTLIINYRTDVGRYLRQAMTPMDFLRLMQVRLSQSKIGRLACPSPMQARVKLRWFGAQPIVLRSHTTDICVMNELIGGGYSALERHMPSDAKLIVDLGANTGLVARWLSDKCPVARVIAVEPAPGNARTAKENASARTQVFEAAIGGTRRTAQLRLTGGEHGFALVDDARGAPTIDVPVLTMADILPETGDIDVLKVDIEGGEVELFADCAAWIGRVKLLLVECHAEYKLSNLLADLGRAGASFRLLDQELKPEMGFEIGLLQRT